MPVARDARAKLAPTVAPVDSSYLESLVGYNARRAALAVIAVFLRRMRPYDLRPVEFSVLSLVRHNTGITARQICTSLGLQPPNLVGMLKALQGRGLVERQDHPQDRRAYGLHLTPAGRALMTRAEKTVSALEHDAVGALSVDERHTLMRLLQKVYLP